MTRKVGARGQTRWLLPEVVTAIHQMLIAEHGGLPGIRDQGLLDSALARPRQQAAYGKKNSVFQLAAAYSYGLARNHPFVDGNKRIALTVAAVFLEINGYSLNASEAEAVIIYQQLADGRLTEEALARWLRESSVLNS
ncbi:MAG: type II toxin-antitoxin system death-on-curing family toxin [Burkholderiales bacterium]|nr:type II toxin-antitoxin system death-on-curing family toxin [Burkholderiales bacterium]MDP2398300.1 type II toxin-antitoxin system death-on-curing family toxin [Burkholderiales bacterium]